MPALQDQPASLNQITTLYQAFVGTPYLRLLDQKIERDEKHLHFRINLIEKNFHKYLSVQTALEELEQRFGFTVSKIKRFGFSIENKEVVVRQAIEKMHDAGYFFETPLIRAAINFTLGLAEGVIISLAGIACLIPVMAVFTPIDFFNLCVEFLIGGIALGVLLGIVMSATGFLANYNFHKPLVVDISVDRSTLSNCSVGLLHMPANADDVDDVETLNPNAETAYIPT